MSAKASLADAVSDEASLTVDVATTPLPRSDAEVLSFHGLDGAAAKTATDAASPDRPPILKHEDADAPSLFTAGAMLSLARKRKGLADGRAPEVCVLDPDGDLERHLQAGGDLCNEENWGCFHTRLGVCHQEGQPFGIIGRAVGGAFSVLLAEQLFASGCRFLISLSSAGQVVDLGPPPYFVVIDRALRDEGTSYHYLAPTRYAEADSQLICRILPSLIETGIPLHVGASWTTDAPFRETETKVSRRRAEGLLTVEMEAAALYAFAASQQKAVLCLAQVTNRINCSPDDFSKGVAEGAESALLLICAAATAWRESPDGVGAARSGLSNAASILSQGAFE